MKILAIYDQKGSKFHRIYLPLSYLNKDKYEVVFIDKFPEDVDSVIDIVKPELIYFHWVSNLVPGALSVIKNKGIKIYIDVDDYWAPSKHSIRNRIVSVAPLLHKQLEVADVITTSTEYLREKLQELYNTPVVVIPNELPSSFNRANPRKGTIGLCGSISHLYDWLTIHSEYLRAIKAGYKFVICGAASGSDWAKIRSKFNKATFIDNLPVTQYMALYDEIDILWCPLEDTNFNRGKSSLKLKEGLRADCKIVASPLYLLKEDRVDSKRVKYSNQYFKESLEFEEDDADLDTPFYNRMKILVNTLNLPKQPEMTMDNLYSIHYSPEQVQYCIFNPIFNPVRTVEEKSYLFEYNPILNVLPNLPDGGYTGFFSWKFPYKTQISKEAVINTLNFCASNDTDVAVFCQQIHKYLEFTNKYHPGFKVLFEMLCEDLGLQVKEPRCVIYSNFFCMKTHLYKELGELFQKAIVLMETDKYKDVWNNAFYKSGLDKYNLKNQTGLEHYTFHTFLLERLPSIFVHNNNLTYYLYK